MSVSLRRVVYPSVTSVTPVTPVTPRVFIFAKSNIYRSLIILYIIKSLSLHKKARGNRGNRGNQKVSGVQISGYLSKQEKHISHETIYRIIRKDKRDGGSLYKNCRHRLKHRTRPVGGKRISIPNRTSISERPAEADGKRFGDFEMDTIVGKDGHGAIVTLTERSTNMLFMRKLNKGKNAKELARTVIHLLAPFKGRVKSITTDNGTEFACHEMIAKSIGVKVYFADPYSSWQKGAIENINGLIRQYIPKSTSFSNVSHQQINKIMHKINTRPREKLNFSTPRECFYEKIS